MKSGIYLSRLPPLGGLAVAEGMILEKYSKKGIQCNIKTPCHTLPTKKKRYAQQWLHCCSCLQCMPSHSCCRSAELRTTAAFPAACSGIAPLGNRLGMGATTTHHLSPIKHAYQRWWGMCMQVSKVCFHEMHGSKRTRTKANTLSNPPNHDNTWRHLP